MAEVEAGKRDPAILEQRVQGPRSGLGRPQRLTDPFSHRGQLGWLAIRASMCTSRPTSASWINQVDRWFAKLSGTYIHRGTHRFTRQLEQTIRQCIQFNHTDPKLFDWTKSVDDMLASVKEFCLETSH
ncbi:hypothetical protein [Caballeronia sp. LZ035]|uniref:hypothetical protein n=1 Tax=Caballeronia sp. LZ035 TaxID=3038568 RepID=UPI00285CBF5B|nr:hypothetical protein [Caballeronia sp. LZ035]MDR5755995.1 hypothetical protein [Caballeronia sp. LZ035]